MKISLLVILTFSILGCTDITAPAVEEADLSLLFKSWTHSFEEQSNYTLELYRPSDYKQFTVLRFRGIYRFYENGTCIYLVLEPGDRHYFETGTWVTTSQDRFHLQISDSSGNAYRKIHILDLREELLLFENE